MPHYANIHNAHLGNMLSSNQGILQGCGGCTGNGGGVIQARGIVGRKKGGKSRRRRKRRNNSRKKERRTKHRRRRRRGGSAPSGSVSMQQQIRKAHAGQQLMLTRGQLGGSTTGNGYGMTSATAATAAHQGMGYGSTPMASYNNCKIYPPFKMGAGRPYSSIAAMQKGAGKNLTVNQSNNLSNAGYGYKGGDVKAFAGSYPPVSSTSYEQTCQQEGGAAAVATRRKLHAVAPPGGRRVVRAALAEKQATTKTKPKKKSKKKSPTKKAKSKKKATTAAPGKKQKVSTKTKAAVAKSLKHPAAKKLKRAAALKDINMAAEYTKKAAANLQGGSRIKRLGQLLIKPFTSIAEAGHNAIRGVAQSSSLSGLTYPSQAGGRRRSRRNKRKRNRKSRRRRPRRRRKRNTRHRRKRKKTRRRKRQRGGYAQYQSNLPLTSTLSLPAGAAGGTWIGQLASPPTYSRINDCHNNYNHFTGQNSPSPVLDGAAPQLPSLGGN